MVQLERKDIILPKDQKFANISQSISSNNPNTYNIHDKLVVFLFVLFSKGSVKTVAIPEI